MEDQENPTTHDPNVSVSASSDGRGTIYVRPPVSPEIKKNIVRAGFRILSANFAPEGSIIYNGQTGDPDTEEAEAEAEPAPAPKPKAKPRVKKA